MPILKKMQELKNRIYFIPEFGKEEDEEEEEFIKECEELRFDLANVLGMTVIVGRGVYVYSVGAYIFPIDLPKNKRDEIWKTIKAIAEEKNIKLGKDLKIDEEDE